MKINISNAVKLFFAKPSLEMVYFEAIANSIDAGATSIEVKINIESYSKPETLEVSIKDNGDGFTDNNFQKFSQLLEVEEEDHKGVGRLVFLHYFNKAKVSSVYGNKKREFLFSNKFDGDSKMSDVEKSKNETIILMEGYKKGKIRSYDYLKPDAIKKSILSHFLPLLYSMKIDGTQLSIKLILETKESNITYNFSSQTKSIDVQQIPELKKIVFSDERIDLFEELKLFYSIRETEEVQSVTTALCVDNRTIPVDVLSKGGIPQGHEVVFLLYSKLFKGKTNASRQALTLSESDLSTVKKVFREKIAEIINKAIPKIKERNEKVNASLDERYPHLQGYFEKEAVGLVDRDELLKGAQSKFFKDQQEILDAVSLDETQYEKSIEVSSRVLMEYILYRNIIIKKLKEVDLNSSETDIHNIIVPIKKTLTKNDFIKDIYNNNAWLLDDKYMSYSTILSDRDMDHLIREIALDDEIVEKDTTRPDIAMVFSSDPKNDDSKLDVVVVELKKKGLKLAKREEVISQLRQRARKLLNYYPNRIQRIWFYGVVDFDKEFVRSLKEEQYLQIYSAGDYFYKELNIIPDYDENKIVPIGVNLLSFDALLSDAENRNSTFLNLLKDSFKNR